MILIEKPAAPEKLSDGKPLTSSYCNDFKIDADFYNSGEKKFDFKSNIYGHESVKNRLREAHHGKCCFCEGVFEANAAGDVEHYRPKHYSQQGHGMPKIYPGYYWLAYDWDNLFYSCQDCNRSHKRNYFPLRDPEARVRNHLGDLAAEAPLILCPGGPENPRDHIHFRQEIALGKSNAGKSTIEIVGLNRLSLTEERLELLKPLRALRDIVRLFANHDGEDQRNELAAARGLLGGAVRPEFRFSAMMSDFLSDDLSEAGVT
ncbi:MAG: hypothetical protein OXC05_15960 [Halieaceae bacterium]|nr:hypothetical protein [Halieaceae bacterium]